MDTMHKKVLLATLAISVAVTGSVLSVSLLKKAKLMTRKEIAAKTNIVKQNMIGFNEKIRFEKLNEQPVSSQLPRKKIAKVQKLQKANETLEKIIGETNDYPEYGNGMSILNLSNFPQ